MSKSIVTLCFSLLLTFQQYAQIPLNIPSKDERYAKKIEKSPAVDEIKRVEANIKQLDANISRRSDLLTFGNDEEAFKSFEEPYTKIKNGIPAITAKDPKWKVEEYNIKLADYTKKFDEINVAYAANNRIKALADSLNRRERKYRSVDWTPDGCGCGESYESYHTNCNCGDAYYNFIVNRLNITLIQKDLEELFKLKPDFLTTTTSYDYKHSVGKLNDEYRTNWSNTKTQRISTTEKFIERALAMPAGTEFPMMGALKDHKRYIEAFVAVDPADANLTATIKKIDAAIEKINASALKINMVTPERTGKMVFTTTDAKREEFEAAVKTTTWDISTPLHLRWFLEKPAADYHGALPSTENGRWMFRDAHDKHVIYVNGKMFHEDWFQSYDDIEKEYGSALTLRGSYDINESFGRDLIMKIINDLGAGTYDIKIEVYIGNDKKEYTEKPVVTGECKLTVSAAAIAKLLSSSEFCAPPAGMVDANLSAQMMAVMKEQKWKEVHKKMIITSKNWTIVKNKYTGVTVSRHITAVVLSEKDGECMKHEVAFEQVNISGNTWGALQFLGVGELYGKILCNCIR